MGYGFDMLVRRSWGEETKPEPQPPEPKETKPEPKEAPAMPAEQILRDGQRREGDAPQNLKLVRAPDIPPSAPGLLH
eukprot:gene23114-43432_t